MHEQWSPLVEITSSLFPFVLLCFNPVREKNRHQSKTIRRENIMNRRENKASSPASSFHIIRVYVSMCVASPLVFTERKIDVTKLRIDIMWILLALVEDNDKLYRTKNDISVHSIYTHLFAFSFPKHWLAQEQAYCNYNGHYWTTGIWLPFIVQVNHKISFPKALWLVLFRPTCDFNRIVCLTEYSQE